MNIMGRRCTAAGQWYCRLNGVCYSEHYVEDTAKAGGRCYCRLNGVCYSEYYVEVISQHVDSFIEA